MNLCPNVKQEHIEAVDIQYDGSVLHLGVFAAIDTGVMGKRIQEATAIHFVARILHSSQSVHQAGVFYLLEIVEETRLVFTREK